MYQEVRSFVVRVKPEILISFGFDGFTGHLDHVTIGAVTKKLAQDLHIPFVTFAKPSRDLFPDFDTHLLKKRKNGCYVDMQPGLSENFIRIEVDPQIKLEALALHKSQFVGLNPHNNFPKNIADHIMESEYFNADFFD